MKQIPLTRGLFAFVDDDKFEFLNQWKWYAVKVHNGFYATRFRKKVDGPGSTCIKMHRVLLGVDETFQCDHIDGNKLNNTMKNLRVVTAQQNRYCFQTKRKRKNSKFRGVCFHVQRKRWQAYYGAGGKQNHIGLFDTAEEASQARDAKIKELFGEFAQLNGGSH